MTTRRPPEPSAGRSPRKAAAGMPAPEERRCVACGGTARPRDMWYCAMCDGLFHLGQDNSDACGEILTGERSCGVTPRCGRRRDRGIV